MIKHTVTIVFGADEGTGFDAVLDSFGNQILAAHGYGVEIDHEQIGGKPPRTCIRCAQLAVCDICGENAVWHWKGGGRDQHLCQDDQIRLREQAEAEHRFRQDWLLTTV